MPRGSSRKREREYQELKEDFEREGRYPGREEEVAARIVNKQRAQLRETQSAREEDRHGQAPDRNLAMARYEHLTVAQVTARLGGLSYTQLRALERHERTHKSRSTLLRQIARRMHH